MKFFVLFALLIASRLACAQSGIVWSPTLEVASSQYNNMHPRVVTDGSGNPMILWGSGDAKEVYFSRWTGNGFVTPKVLNPLTIPIFAASWAGPDIASHGDTVYVVFKETPEHDGGIYIVRSMDGGVNFSPPERVDAIADSMARFPAVVTDANGNPLVSFMKFNPGWGNARHVLAKSVVLGNTFGADVLGSGFSGGMVCDCCPATLTSSGNTTALLYRDNLNDLRNSWAGISLDGGSTFAGGIEIDITDWMINACPSTGPDGIIIGDSLYTVFMSAASGTSLCYRSRSTISTRQMETIEPLTPNFSGLGLQNFPRIAVSGYASAVVFNQTVNGSNQLAVQFTNKIFNGFPSGYSVLAANHVMNADVAISSNGKVHVVWEDMNSGTVKYRIGSFTVSGTKNQSENLGTMLIYPNPATPSVLHCKLDTYTETGITYQVFNAQGQLHISGVGQLSKGEMDLDVTGLRSGFYAIRINLNDQMYVQSVVIE